jgi:hypothetical protein
VLVADNGVVADTPRLHRRRSAEVSDRSYLHLEAFGVEPGEAIRSGCAARRRPRRAGTSCRSASRCSRGSLRWASWSVRCADGRRRRAAGLRRWHQRARARARGDRALARGARRGSRDGQALAEDHAHMRSELRARAAQLLLAPQVSRSEPRASEVHRGVRRRRRASARRAERVCDRATRSARSAGASSPHKPAQRAPASEDDR